MLQPDMDSVGLMQINCDVKQERADLSDDGGNRGSCHTESGKAKESEDQDRIEDDVDHAAGAQQIHGNLHFSDPLENLFKRNLQQGAEGEAEHDVCIVAGILQYGRIIREQREERFGDKDPCQDEEDTVNDGQCNAERGGAVCLFLFSGSEVDGNGRSNPNTYSDGDGDDGVLERIGKRNGSQGICPQPRYIDAVHNIIERLDEHGEHHRYRHGDQKGEYGFCLHETVICFHNKMKSFLRSAVPLLLM